MTTPEPDAAPTARRSRIGTYFDKIPTLWLVLGVVAALFLSTAAFGGLDEVAADPLQEAQASEPVAGAQLTIAVERVVLIDALPEAYLEPEAGNRLLIVVATVENTWHKPVHTLNGVGAGDNLRPSGIPGIGDEDTPLKVLLLSDGTSTPQLQPGLPAELAFVWEVPADAVADGDTVRVNIFDKVYRETGFVTAGERFQEPFLAAFTEVEAQDRDAGEDTEAETEAETDPVSESTEPDTNG